MRKIFSEPLIQFLILGVAIFGVYSLTNGTRPADDTRLIEVGEGQLAQMFETFSRTWQRPPTEAEFKGLIDGYVKESVFYREGQKMGLDKDDTIFRRRMQQKLEFLLEPSVEDLTPKTGELEAYFKRHQDRYRDREKLAFTQIFFKCENPATQCDTAARSALAKLNSDPSIDPSNLGDPSLLPPSMGLTDVDEIAVSFGKEFVLAILTAPNGKWSGPFQSSYGIHLVLVDQKTASETPSLVQATAKVKADWESDKRKQLADKRYADMKKQYDIRIAGPSDMSPAAIKTSAVK